MFIVAPGAGGSEKVGKKQKPRKQTAEKAATTQTPLEYDENKN